MITPRFVFHLGTLLAVAATSSAQTSVANWDTVKSLAAGTQVRVAAGTGTVRGRIDRTTDDAVTVTSGKGQETFDRQQVSVVWVQKPGRRKRNTLIGLAVGTGVGLGIGLAARAKHNQLMIVPNSAVTAGFTVAGALIGTVVGVVIPTGGWRKIYKK